MKRSALFAVALLGLLLMLPSLLRAQKATVEPWEGTVRQIYINKPLIGTRGYLVSNLKEGQGRVEVWGLPQRALGYEVFLFGIDVASYVGLLFKESNPNKGLNDPAPPFDQIAPLVKQSYSLGTLEVNETGRGTLVYSTTRASIDNL